MAWAWHAFALTGLAAVAIAWPMAYFVYRSRPQAWQNRWLALMLLVESVFLGVGWGVLALAESADLAYSLVMVAIFMVLLVPWLYLLFLSTLPTPIARPLATPVGRTLLATGLGISLLVALFARQRVVSTVFEAPRLLWTGWNWGFEPVWAVFVLLHAAVNLFGLVVAVSLFVVTPRSSPRRPAAAAYLAAFAVRDALFLLGLSIFWFDLPALASLLLNLAPPVSFIAFVLLMGYGILKTHLFDIDLKIKWTIRKSTFVGIFVAAFFISAQVAQAFLVTEWGWAAGGIVAGFLLLAINPLQRVAGRLADLAMPGVQDTEQYRNVRKSAVYQAALEEMLADGLVTGKERRALVRLQEQLGLDATLAQHIEAEVLDTIQQRTVV